jgi:hypothetical protein
MPNGLIDADALTEAARELCELAATLNPDADPAELLNLAAAAIGTMTGNRAPDAWLEMAMSRAAEQLRWTGWDE